MIDRFPLRSLVPMAAAVALAIAAPASAERLEPARSVQSRGDLRIEVVDLTPRFLAFYRAAVDARDPDSRFALWKAHYGFGAFPPGPEGEAMARELLDQAWPRYRQELGAIERGAATFGDEPLQTLEAVARTLRADRPISVRLVAFVGGFENNAYAARADGPPTVNFPVEMSADQRRLILPHELTHAVHMELAGLSGGWERTIGATLVQEGLAMHVAREVAPGGPESLYVEHEPGWWGTASGKRSEILSGILPSLDSKDSETVFRFTMGKGPAGLQREAYAAGWWVIEQLRRDGMSLAEIARVPEAAMPGLARRAIARLLRG